MSIENKSNETYVQHLTYVRSHSIVPLCWNAVHKRIFFFSSKNGINISIFINMDICMYH